MEENKERLQIVQDQLSSNQSSRPVQNTAATPHQNQSRHQSKMILVNENAAEMEEVDIQTGRIDPVQDSDDETALLTVQESNKSYVYSEVGVKCNKRIPLQQPYENMLQESMQKRLARIERKIKKYEGTSEQVKLRKYLRSKWAIDGIKVHGFDF